MGRQVQLPHDRRAEIVQQVRKLRSAQAGGDMDRASRTADRRRPAPAPGPCGRPWRASRRRPAHCGRRRRRWRPSRSCRPARARLAEVAQDLARGVRAGCGHDAAARMVRRAAHVEALDRRAVLRPAGDRAVEQELVEGQLALEDVALGEADLVLDVERRADLLVDDQLAEVRGWRGRSWPARCRRTPRARRRPRPGRRSARRARTGRTRSPCACRGAPWSGRSGSGSAGRNRGRPTSGRPSSRRRRAPGSPANPSSAGRP